MKIDDFISRSIDAEGPIIEPNPIEIDRMWLNLEAKISSKKKNPVHLILNKLGNTKSFFNASGLIEIAIFACVLFVIPALISRNSFNEPADRTAAAGYTSLPIKSSAMPVSSPDVIIPNGSKIPNDIVLYNSHYTETYAFGESVLNVTQILNSKLSEKGFNTVLLQPSDPDNLIYTEAYNKSNELIKNNVPEYKDKILLDIHREETNSFKNYERKILIILSKGNPGYEKNKVFADMLINEINKSGTVTAEILTYANKVNFSNQDLSQYALLVNIGTEASSRADINECIGVLTDALGSLLEGN